ncbi:hypothetical protein [Vitiosangium sp. GDMCC 1.1324]|uniref:hypothetical protein n=1 Tax=Vitiosangium sp. (strain GDMCC 1.1324) TaxID=2138576 RepID=UPI0018EE6084|nr:hypothetical protein [Vitiosangium sp. GDMCC 1.1324]
MSRSLLLSLALVSVLGCARAVKPEDATPRYEHIYYTPVEEALAATRTLMQERGFAFEETEDPNQLLTQWKQPVSGTRGNGFFERYLVVGIRVAPRQSVVRIFRMRRAVTGNDVEVRSYMKKSVLEEKEWMSNPSTRNPQFFQTAGVSSLGGVAHGTRDLELEKVLALRLESGASVETLSGNVREAPPARALSREPSFYLQRWKTDAAATASAESPCPRQVQGLRELLRPGLTLLVGEQLGTRETPEVVGDMVCEAAALGLPVALGVSVSQVEQARLDAYLASPGAPADQDELLRGDFWRKPHQDGRSSRAMMELVDRVRSLRASGLPVSLVAFGVETSTGSQRDMQMADALLVRREKQREEVLLVLAGNVHVQTREGVSWDEHFIPMAWHLAKADKNLVALDLSYAPGSRWGCDLKREGDLECGIVGTTPHPRVSAPPGLNPNIRLFEKPTEEGFHGLLYVGALSPSMPAVSQTEVEPPVPSSVPRKYIRQTQGLSQPQYPPIF